MLTKEEMPSGRDHRAADRQQMEAADHAESAAAAVAFQ